MKVTVDLNKKEMDSAFLDGKSLTEHDTVCLLWFLSFSSEHVKIHALANWAHSDPSRKARSMSSGKAIRRSLADAYHRRMSAVSILYNFFGVRVFPKLASLFYCLGIVSQDMSESISGVFKESLHSGIDYHGNLEELINHSDIVRFVCRFRPKFLRRFRQHLSKYPSDFQGVDAESMFVSTVLHSLDHKLLEWNLKDPLWLDYDNVSEEFHPLIEMGRYVRTGFLEDLPGVLFARKYKHVNLPFYREVYQEALRIDPKFANEMDTTIVK